MPEMRVCPACGHSAEARAAFCPACGTRFAADAEQPAETEPVRLGGPPPDPPTQEIEEPPPTVEVERRLVEVEPTPAAPQALAPFPPHRAEEASPPAAPPAPPGRIVPWATVASVLGVVAGIGATAFVAASVRYRRVPFPIAAWAFAGVPIAYAIVRGLRDRKAGGRGRPIFGGALAILVLAATTVFVLRSCEPQLGPRADLAGCDFSELDLSGRDLNGTDLTGAKLAGADLSDANLTNAKLAGADLNGASLENANLAGASLDDVDLRETILDGALLERAHMAKVNLSGIRPGTLRFREADLTGADLTGTTLDEADLHGAVLDEANLKGTTLSSADLSQASLKGAKLEGTTLAGADLEGADLSRAQIVGADLSAARLNGADLTDATLTRLSLKGAILIGVTGLPDATLAGALQIGAPALGGMLSAQEIRLEERDAIVTSLSHACSGRGPVPQAAPYGGGGLHPIVIATADGKPSLDFAEDALGLHWEPMAVRFGQLVACVGDDRPASIQVCRYSFSGGRPAPPITRYEHRRKIRVVEARTGKVILERTVVGTEPDACPLFTNQSNTRIDGDTVTFADLEPILAKLVK